jgi:hypothetical protein
VIAVEKQIHYDVGVHDPTSPTVETTTEGDQKIPISKV